MVREGLMDGTTRLMTDFWDEGLTNNLSIGEALSAARQRQISSEQPYAGLHWLMSGVNLLGDPTLPVRNAAPVSIELNLPQQAALGKALELSIPTGISGLTVCAWQGDDMYEVVTSDETGLATLNLLPQTAGDVLITVSGPAINTVTTTITVK